MLKYDVTPAPTGAVNATDLLSLEQFMAIFSQTLNETTIKPKKDHEKHN